jgi:SAM-dependent methyltransferase
VYISPAREAALEESRVQWDSLSAAWLRWQDTFERGGEPVTTRLMELGGVRPGHRILDVGTGLGQPALTAARAVGPTGSVIGIDLSPEMIRLARGRALGISNVEFVAADPEHFETGRPFDVILSRWCLMLVPDRGETLRALRKLLVPGGVLAAAVWGPAATAPMMSLAFAVLGPLLELTPPSADQPGPFTMADPQQCRTELTAAGFGPVSVVVQDAPFWVESPGEYARFARDVLPPRFQQIMRDRLGSPDDSQAWRAVAEKAAEHIEDGRVMLTSRAFCVRGVASAG